MKKEFNFRFLNMAMYIAAFIGVFYVLLNLGVIDLLVKVNTALVPVYIGLLVCFLTMPIARKFRKWGLNKSLSSILSLLVIYLIIGILFSLVIPLFITQLTSFITNLPDIYSEVINSVNKFIANNFGNEYKIALDPNLTNLSFVSEYLDNIVSYSIDTVQNGFGIIISFFTTIIVSFFLVKDMDNIRDGFINYFSKNGKDKRRKRLYIEIEGVVFNYVKGIAVDSIIVGALTALLCFVLRIDYAIVFGLLITFLNFIPYIGAIVSEVVISLYAITIGGPIYALITFGLLILIQIVDANILQPNIIGKSVNLHPVIVFIGLIIGNILLGIFGMIIAIPVLAVIRVVLKYRKKKFIED